MALDPPTALKADPAAEAGAEPARDEAERTLRDRAPKKRGRPPKAKPQAQGAALKARSKVLEAKLAELLTFPAMPAAMLSAADPFTQAYMIEHFTRSGPRTAAALVEASESNAQLRAILERVCAGGSLLAVVIALTAYAAPPVLWVIGMREQAARITQTTTMTQAELEAMLQAANARAQAEYENAAATADNGAAGAAPAPGADSQPAE
jgi:hypothetical protein